MTTAHPTLLTWTASADRDALEAQGWDVIDFVWLCRDVAAPGRGESAGRRTLDNPARPWLARVAAAGKLAVVGVALRTLDDVAALHGYVLEPAWRARTSILIESEHRLTRLALERFIDPEFEYPHTLERALHAAMSLYRAAPEETGEHAAPAPVVSLDPEQRRAAAAHEGVVQVIAPAGSGKTTVLIERVRALLHRGVPAGQILCTTFNRDARVELDERLRAAGIHAVEARTFHSLGLKIIGDERLARPNGTRQLSLGQFKRLCALAAREEGTWIDVTDARAAISDIKLGMLASPAEFRRRAHEQQDGSTLARIYELYEQQLAELDVNDFDDHVMLAVRALREDPELRGRWQARFTQVLVDEYQDIEPAQELLVRILAAPQDGFFCVGDEDQTLYGWRRASVRRMIDLDRAYPGLQRISLAHNYRCPPEIVAASRQLIEHNTVRFPKPIQPAPDRVPGGARTLGLHEHDDHAQAAGEVARVLAGSRRGEIVILARTTNLLRTVALACVDLGVRITAPEAVFEPRGARQALEAHLRLCGDPRKARPEDVVLVCRAPNRGLPFEAETQVAESLRRGHTFSASLTSLQAGDRQRSKLDQAGTILDALAGMTDASRFVAFLRVAGGLDDHFAEYESAFAGTEQVELEVLDQATAEAAGRSVAQYGAVVQGRTDALRAIRDDEHGIELTTIHRAKGRQWPEVQLFACEERQLPHRHSFEATDEERAAGEGVEAERRLAYVAFTRAQRALAVHTTETAASRFLTEAGLDPAQPYQRPAPPRAPGQATRSRRGTDGRERAGSAPTSEEPVAAGLDKAQRIGLGYALRTAATREVALGIAAGAIEQRLIGPATTSQSMTLTKLLAAVEQLTDSERRALLGAADVEDGEVPVRRLDATARARLVRALRDVAGSRAWS
ncbi:MAG: ATP-dependent helicase [Solirubrobacteraceae bacterium MAG38_C4-C5]|nr:ATP-dependent helicase [Candidatus Siliceabacter maunaloa]